MKTKIDMQNFDGLERLYGATLRNATVYADYWMCIAVSEDGEVYALNHFSEDPRHINNRGQRAAWARAVGVGIGEVESYVRRKRNQEKREARREQIEDAVFLANSPEGRRIAAELKKAGKL